MKEGKAIAFRDRTKEGQAQVGKKEICFGHVILEVLIEDSHGSTYKAVEYMVLNEMQ